MNEYDVVTYDGENTILKLIESKVNANIINKNPLMKGRVWGSFYSNLACSDLGEAMFSEFSNQMPENAVQKHYGGLPSEHSHKLAHIVIKDDSVELYSDGLRDISGMQKEFSYVLLAADALKNNFAKTKRSVFQKEVDYMLRKV